MSGEAGRALVDGAGPDLTALDERVAVRVKESPVRTVWRLGDAYVKEYRAARAADLVRTLFMGSKARSEWRTARRLRELGFPTFEPLAMGERRRGPFIRRAILATRAIAEATPLADLLAPGRMPARPRRDLIRLAAALVRRLHDAGVEHRDLHAGNLLVTGAGAGRPVVHVIDLHRVRFRRRLSRRARVRNLGLLAMSFQRRASGADRLRFLRAYLGTGTGARKMGPDPIYSSHEVRAIAGEVLRGAARQERRLLESRDRRCLKSGKYFGRVCNLRVTALVVKELEGASWLERPETLMDAPTAEMVKDGRSARVVRLELPAETGPRRVYVKRFNMWKAHQRFLRTRAMRAWQLGHAMLNRALPTPRPLAAVNVRWLGLFSRRCYLVTEEIPGAVHLDEALGRPDLAAEAKAALAAAVGRVLARMHDAGFQHRDLKFRNILATLPAGERGGAAPGLNVLDLDAVRHGRGRLPRRRRVRDLARLLVSFEELAQAGGPGSLRDLWRTCLSAYLGPAVRESDLARWNDDVRARAGRLATVRHRRRRAR